MHWRLSARRIIVGRTMLRVAAFRPGATQACYGSRKVSALFGKIDAEQGALAATALSRVEGRQSAIEVGLEISDVLQSDMEPQRRAARRPLGGGAVTRAIEGNDKALEAAP